MVKKKQKELMREYVLDRLNDNSRVKLKRNEEKYLVLENEGDEEVNKIVLALHFGDWKIEEFKRLQREIRQANFYESNVFLKNGKDFHVRLAEKSKGQFDKSLKMYNPQEFNRMLHLRGLEKVVGESTPGYYLSYYQEESPRLDEQIRVYKMNPVMLNYSHVNREHRSHGFVENRPAIDYKLPEIIREADAPLGFTSVGYGNKVILMPLEKEIKKAA